MTPPTPPKTDPGTAHPTTESLQAQIKTFNAQIAAQNAFNDQAFSDLDRSVSSLKHRIDDLLFAKNAHSKYGSQYKTNHGDALSDALLFGDIPSEAQYIPKIYGLSADEVMDFYFKNDHDDGGLLDVLNTHLASRTRFESDVAFRIFIMTVRLHWLQRPTQVKGSELEVAYWNFWVAHDKAKTETTKMKTALDKRTEERRAFLEEYKRRIRAKPDAPS